MADVDFDKQEQALLARAAAFRAATATRGNKSRVVNEAVVIFSDGVRMAGTVWRPDTQGPGDKLPAILLCHGWGGKRAHLDFSYAPKFAAAGFVVLTFDYRGWGDSAGYVPLARGGGGEVARRREEGYRAGHVAGRGAGYRLDASSMRSSPPLSLAELSRSALTNLRAPRFTACWFLPRPRA